MDERPDGVLPPAAPEPAASTLWGGLRAALVFAILFVLASLSFVYLRRPFVDLVLDTYRTATFIGINAPKAFALAGVGLVFLAALPLAVADGVSSARFRRAERDLREAHPQAEVLAYEGPEGRGLLFDASTGRVLLLRPPGGLGRPRVVRPVTVPSPSPAADTAGG